MRVRIASNLALALVLAVTAAAQIAPGGHPPRARVLFIGNSLTCANDLPAMIEAIAADAGLAGRVTVRAVAQPDFGLEEHWDDGGALRAIERERWTLVVLQQGPTSLPASQTVLRGYTKKCLRDPEERREGRALRRLAAGRAVGLLRFRHRIVRPRGR